MTVDLCTLAQLHAALNIGALDTSQDVLLADLIDAASAWAENHCHRIFGSASYTEYFSPGAKDWRVSKDRTALRPKNYPIISVTTLHEDPDRVYAATELIASADYWNDDLFVRLYGDGATVEFTAGERTVKLVYVAGYAAIPADLSRAGVMLAVHLYHSADKMKQGVASQSLGDQTVTFTDQAMPKEVEKILAAYVRPWGL